MDAEETNEVIFSPMNLFDIFDHSQTLSRREWIKHFMFGSVGSTSGIALMLAEVTQAAQPGPGRLRLRVADYPALQSVGGSVQLQFSSIYDPLTINRVSNTEFATLDSICTHAGCPVDKFIAADGYMLCPCHGSQFNARGQVVGGPAVDNMKAFPTTFDAAAGMIEVAVPDLGLNVNSIQTQSKTGGVTRFKLVFQATAFATYEVRYQSELGGPSVLTPFSTTPNGVATQTSLVANNSAAFTVYVDASGDRGFFSVSMRLTSI
jgi:Rieske Fe-S protein